MAASRRPPVDPIDVPMTPIALTGTAVWGAVGLVLLAVRADPGVLRICLAGFLAGWLLSVAMIRHDRHRRHVLPDTAPTGRPGGQ